MGEDDPAKGFAAAMDVGLDLGQRHLEPGGDVLVAEVLEVEQDQGHALGGREPFERGFGVTLPPFHKYQPGQKLDGVLLCASGCRRSSSLSSTGQFSSRSQLPESPRIRRSAHIAR